MPTTHHYFDGQFSQGHSQALVRRPAIVLSSILSLLLSASATFAQDQSHGFANLLSGKDHPLSIQLKEFGADWRKVTIHSSANVSDNVSVNVSGGNGSTSQNNLVGAMAGSRAYLTKGETAAAGGRIFLVAYRLPVSSFDLSVLIQALATKAAPTATKLTADTALALSLLDTASLGSLDEVRPFSLESEIAESESTAHTLAELLKSQGGGSTTNSPGIGKSPK